MRFSACRDGGVTVRKCQRLLRRRHSSCRLCRASGVVVKCAGDDGGPGDDKISREDGGIGTSPSPASGSPEASASIVEKAGMRM